MFRTISVLGASLMFTLLVACSDSSTGTSGSSSGGSSGNGTSGGSSSGTTSTSSGSSSTSKFSCKINGTCYKCPSAEGVSKCASDIEASGCTVSSDPKYCDG